MKIPITAKRTAKPGQYTVKAKLRYQPCSEKVCLPPKQVNIDIPVEVAASGQPVKHINTDIFGSGRSRPQKK